MPTYEYRCSNGHDFEDFVLNMSAAKLAAPCPTCGLPGERRLSAGGGLLFKGSGFYITDYGKDGKKSENARRASGAGDGAKADGVKAEGGKGDGAKADSAKGDSAKDDSAKGDSAKAGSAKADAGKSESRKQDAKPAAPSPGTRPPGGE